MIVRGRKEGPGFVLVEQYEHGLISGEFARHWGWSPRPSDSALYAIAEHDLAWKELDAELRWNPEEGRPYAFFEYPAEPRLAAYSRGVDAVERQDPYAGLLCSLHYESFVRNATGPAESSFRAAERERQSRLMFAISDRQRERVDAEISLLRMCDDLSLFVCLNHPGENAHPWYREGFTYGETRLAPVWESPSELRFEPSPFTRSFEIAVPHLLIRPDGSPAGAGEDRIRISA